jgi:hypothetical protein
MQFPSALQDDPNCRGVARMCAIGSKFIEGMPTVSSNQIPRITIRTDVVFLPLSQPSVRGVRLPSVQLY